MSLNASLSLNASTASHPAPPIGLVSGRLSASFPAPAAPVDPQHVPAGKKPSPRPAGVPCQPATLSYDAPGPLPPARGPVSAALLQVLVGDPRGGIDLRSLRWTGEPATAVSVVSAPFPDI